LEVRSLLRILLRRWWIVLPVAAITFGSVLVYTFAQRPVYASSSTLLLTPSGAIEDDVLSALATISRQPEIAETYAQIANSRTIRVTAQDALNLNEQQASDVRLESRLVPGTIVLELSVRSTDPALAQAYCDAVRVALIDYAGQLQGTFDLETLDEASATQNPVSPNVPINAAVGAGLAVLLALGLALTAELLTPRGRVAPSVEMVDGESQAYSRPFFLLRLQQEMSRTRRSGATLSVALMNVNHGGVLFETSPRSQRDALRRLAGLLTGHVRAEDVVARVDPHIFAILLPDTTEGEAVTMIEATRRRIAVPAVGVESGGEVIHVQPAAGIVQFSRETLSADELLDRARRALSDAESVPIGATQGFSTLHARTSG
jgi:diguanylate cyclase (GGDEF)-like protein